MKIYLIFAPSFNSEWRYKPSKTMKNLSTTQKVCKAVETILGFELSPIHLILQQKQYNEAIEYVQSLEPKYQALACKLIDRGTEAYYAPIEELGGVSTAELDQLMLMN